MKWMCEILINYSDISTASFSHRQQKKKEIHLSVLILRNNNHGHQRSAAYQKCIFVRLQRNVIKVWIGAKMQLKENKTHHVWRGTSANAIEQFNHET